MPPSELRLLGHNKVACFITRIVSVPENLVISSHKCGGYPEHPYECHYSIEWTSLLLNPKINRGPPMIPAVTVEITSNVVNAFRPEPPPAPSFVIDCGSSSRAQRDTKDVRCCVLVTCRPRNRQDGIRGQGCSGGPRLSHHDAR